MSLAVSTRVYAIAAAFPPAKLKDKAEKLEARKEALTEFLDHADEGQPLLHPSMAQMYQDRISEPYENLQSEEDPGADVDVLRSLTDEFASCPGTANSPSSFAATCGDPELCSRKGKPRPPFGGRGFGQPAFAAIVGCGRAQQTLAARGRPKSENLRGRTGGGIESIVGCGGRI